MACYKITVVKMITEMWEKEIEVEAEDTVSAKEMAILEYEYQPPHIGKKILFDQKCFVQGEVKIS